MSKPSISPVSASSGRESSVASGHRADVHLFQVHIFVVQFDTVGALEALLADVADFRVGTGTEIALWRLGVKFG